MSQLVHSVFFEENSANLKSDRYLLPEDITEYFSYIVAAVKKIKLTDPIQKLCREKAINCYNIVFEDIVAGDIRCPAAAWSDPDHHLFGEISISKQLFNTELNYITVREITNILIHEFGHLIAGPDIGHESKWKTVCKKIAAELRKENLYWGSDHFAAYQTNLAFFGGPQMLFAYICGPTIYYRNAPISEGESGVDRYLRPFDVEKIYCKAIVSEIDYHKCLSELYQKCSEAAEYYGIYEFQPE